MGTSTDITGYGVGVLGATLAKVTDCSRSPQLGSARVDVGEEGVSLTESIVDGCSEDREDGVAGERQPSSSGERDAWIALVNHFIVAPSMIISSSMSDMVRQG